MKTFSLNYQVSLFGDYPEVTPTVSNSQKAFERFSSQGMIPGQAFELKINPGGAQPVATSRLSLGTPDQSWRITFNSDRLDLILTNVDLNVFDMPPFVDFVSKSKEYIALANSIFEKSFRRIGVIQNILISEISIDAVERKFGNSIPFFSDKKIGEWYNRKSTRFMASRGEELNVVSDIRSIKTPVRIDSKQTIFDGILVNLDINTLDENRDYRFNGDNYVTIIKEISDLHVGVSQQIISRIEK